MNGMQALRPNLRNPNDGSRTITLDPTDSQPKPSGSGEAPAVLLLRGGPVRNRRITWGEEVVDNEGMGKKKSKICCIYHKPRAFDESSSSDSSSSESEADDAGPSKVPSKKGNETDEEGESKQSHPHSHSKDCSHSHPKHHIRRRKFPKRLSDSEASESDDEKGSDPQVQAVTGEGGLKTMSKEVKNAYERQPTSKGWKPEGNGKE